MKTRDQAGGMDWVHCNKCCIKPSSKVSFELTSCGHLLCSTCIKQSSNGLCGVCAIKCTSVTLSPPLPPQVEMCLTDPVTTLRKIKQVYSFQDNNRLKLYRSYLLKAEANLEKLENKYQTLRKENQYLHFLLSQNVPASPYPISTPHPINRQITPMISRQITLETPQSLGLKKYTGGIHHNSQLY